MDAAYNFHPTCNFFLISSSRNSLSLTDTVLNAVHPIATPPPKKKTKSQLARKSPEVATPTVITVTTVVVVFVSSWPKDNI